MKVTADPRLFWFLKEGASLDLDDPSTLDLYVQQVITRGRAEDVRSLLKTVDLRRLSGCLKRVGPFLPEEVREFWKDFLAAD